MTQTSLSATSDLVTAAMLALLFWTSPVAAGDAAAPREPLKQDVYVALTLAGAHCGRITSVAENAPSDYSVQCQNGKRFRVYVTDNQIVHVVDRSPGAGGADAMRNDHQSRVARGLFAVVNLSGYDCDRVVGVEREPPLGYRVSCHNDTQYRISVVGDGRVKVEQVR